MDTADVHRTQARGIASAARHHFSSLPRALKIGWGLLAAGLVVKAFTDFGEWGIIIAFVIGAVMFFRKQKVRGSLLCSASVVAIILTIWSNELTSKPTAAQGPVLAPISEQAFAQILENALNQNKQQIFDKLHPMGTAKSIKVHEVKIRWRNDTPSADMNNIRGFTSRYTLYWQSPLIDDGFTKLASTYDAESQRYTDTQVLATNGITNSDAAATLGYGFGALLRQAMSDNH